MIDPKSHDKSSRELKSISFSGGLRKFGRVESEKWEESFI